MIKIRQMVHLLSLLLPRAPARSVDALSLSRWLAANALTAADVRPARQTVHLILRDLGEVIGLLNELEWPGETSPPSST